MKNNPVLKREMRVRARSLRMPFIILIFNGILAAAALLNMYSAVSKVKISATIQYESFLQLYAFVASLEFLMLMFIMPAMTSGSISGERERKTLELLFTTKMTAADIVIGKLLSAVSQLLILIVSSFPILLLTFVYGSVNLPDLGLLVICLLVTAFFCGAVGIFSSSLMKRSTFSNVCTYGFLLFLVLGTYMLNLFLFNLSRNQINNMAFQPGEAGTVPGSGGAVYLLLLNPLATFAEIMGNQVSGGAEFFSIRKFMGEGAENVLMSYWIPISLGIQSVVSLGLIRGAICFIDPLRKEGRRK